MRWVNDDGSIWRLFIDEINDLGVILKSGRRWEWIVFDEYYECGYSLTAWGAMSALLKAVRG